MHRRDNLLFYEGDLHGTLDNLTRQISEKVNAIPKDQFLSTPEQDLVDHIYAEMHIEPLNLHEDSMEMEQHETKIDVSGYRHRNPFGDREKQGQVLTRALVQPGRSYATNRFRKKTSQSNV